MRIILKKRYSALIFGFLITSIPLLSQEAHHKWQRMSGLWDIKNSMAYETQGKAVDWNYYELLNLNSILSIKTFSNYSSLEFTLNITERIESPAEIMFAFNVTSESKSWFYHMYAFKLTGGYWGINRAALIYSDRADKSRPYTVKNNVFVKELASAECKVKYDRIYTYNIVFEGSNVILYINGEKILSAPIPEKNYDGKIAFSSRNAKIVIDKITVKNNKQIIFEDDFNENSIFVKILKVQKVPVTNGNNVEDKKP